MVTVPCRAPMRGPAKQAQQARGGRRRERLSSDNPWENLDSD
jgi:hypothetical protein